MSFLNDHDWSFPVPIAYGPGRLTEIGDRAKTAGMTRPLIVTDKGSATLPFIAAVQRHLAGAGLSSGVFSEISPNPRDDEIAAGVIQYRSDQHDGVIAIGGGSGMDGGKAVALTATNDISLWDFEFEHPAPDLSNQPPFPPLICIPTTAGTGAETESTAMVTDTTKGMKFCIWHKDLKPACALLDPELTLDLPKTLTAWTGADALTHAIEAYCVNAVHPLCDGAALEAMRLIGPALPRAFDHPDDLEARGQMLVGSCLAGVAFLKGLGLVHAISHMVGAEFDTQHGLTNATLLVPCTRFNASALGDRIAPMAQALGWPTTFEGFDAGICDLLDRIAIPLKLSDIGVSGDCARRLAEKSIQDSAAATNVRPLTIEAIEQVVSTALDEGR